ncbi:hypothetical protein HHI36_024056 [Cryptolaemus montrouzieri]|uniref:Uncharacterized protein n=1 Tax=Cryptolaemus montrouzieri TaxID=559131 RepID=A0ABD2NIE4_9CUCU
MTETSRCHLDNVKVLNVKRLTSRRSRKHNLQSPIFIIHITAESNMKNSTSVQYIDNTAVWFEKLFRNGPIQCTRCQRMDQASANSALPYRCVKCSESHEPGKCQITEKTTRVNLYCVLCRKTWHPAPYNQYPSKNKSNNQPNSAITSQAKNTVERAVPTTTQKPREITKVAPVKPGTSFAQMVAKNTANAKRETAKSAHMATVAPINTFTEKFQKMFDCVNEMKDQLSSLTEDVKEKSLFIKNFESNFN